MIKRMSFLPTGYKPLAPVTVEQLAALFPTLPQVRLASGPK